MANVRLQPFANDPARLVVDSSPIRQRGVDSEPALLELQALQLEGDLASPEQAAPYFGPLVKLYRGEGSSGDHLRVPAPSNLDGPAVRAAIGRIERTGQTRADRSAAGPKEESMLRMLGALEHTLRQIDRRGSLRIKDDQ